MCGVIHAGHVEITLHPGRFFARKILQRFVCADVLIVLDGFLQQGLCFLGCATLRRPSSATTHNEPWNQSRSDDAHHFPPTVHYPMRSTPNQSATRSNTQCAAHIGPVTGFVHYASMLLLETVLRQDVRGQNTAISVYFRKSLGDHTQASCRD